MSNARRLFSNAISYLLQEGGLVYNEAILRLRMILNANSNGFALKISDLDSLAASSAIREEIERAIREDSYQLESAIGTYQASHQANRDELRINNILVRALDFSAVEAVRVYKRFSSSAGATYHLQDFVMQDMRGILERIVSLVQTKNISADAAHKLVLKEMKNTDSINYSLAANLLSDAMKKAIDENSKYVNASEIILSRLEKGIAEIKIQNANRGARCEASKSVAEYKLDALNDIEVMTILGLDLNAVPGATEKLTALKASIAIDETACDSFGYATSYLQGMFRSAASIPRHLGFFAREQMLEESQRDATEELTVYGTSRQVKPAGIIESTFNVLLQALNHGSTQQFMSLAAMALLMPVANQTLEAITGAQMEYDTPRLGM